MENLDSRINFLAIDYSKTGNEESLKELLEMLRGMIAAKARTFAASTNTSADEYVSLLTEAVWDSIRDGKLNNHDVTKSNVMQRIHTYWVRVHLHVARDERAHRRCANLSAVRLDAPVGEGSAVAAIEWLADARVGDICDVVALRDSLHRFETDHPTESSVIHALARGDDSTTIAKIMGLPSYNACARKRVSRIKQLFREYL